MPGLLSNDRYFSHSQMNKRIFDAFDKREQKLMSFVAGCGKKHGLPCTCAPGTCKCKGGTCCNPAVVATPMQIQIATTNNSKIMMIPHAVNNVTTMTGFHGTAHATPVVVAPPAAGIPIVYQHHQNYQLQQQSPLTQIGRPPIAVMQQVTLPQTQQIYTSTPAAAAAATATTQSATVNANQPI